jgi:hypothetical protein
LIKPHDKEQQTESGLKIYKQPRLEVYGDLRDITRKVGQTSNHDTGGSFPDVNTAP